MAVERYIVTGKYMKGTQVTEYRFKEVSTGKQVKFDTTLTAYMLGQGRIENMQASKNGATLDIRGKGIDLRSLPVVDDKKYDSGVLLSAELRAQQAKEKVNEHKDTLQIIGTAVDGSTKKVVGFVVRVLKSGVELEMTRQRSVEAAANGLFTNGKLVVTDGKSKIVGRDGVNLTALPSFKTGRYKKI
jgi:hypothetical protein